MKRITKRAAFILVAVLISGITGGVSLTPLKAQESAASFTRKCKEEHGGSVKAGLVNGERVLKCLACEPSNNGSELCTVIDSATF